jgi:hypothetical protein
VNMRRLDIHFGDLVVMRCGSSLAPCALTL